MSAAKHTPGPWHVWQPTRRSLPHIRSESGLYVMDAPPRREGVHGQVRQDADARLIAAAPELLEALRETWRVIEQAGLLNLARGVQLGNTVWFVKASDAQQLSDRAIVKAVGVGS